MAWHGALTPEALWRGRGDSVARVWVIVAAYLLGMVVCLCAWRHESLGTTAASAKIPVIAGGGSPGLPRFSLEEPGLPPPAVTERSTEARSDANLPNIWLVAAGVLFLLALDRKLDFLAWVVARGRQVARANGWYWSHRRLIQKTGTLLMVILGLGVIIAFGFCMRGIPLRYRIVCSVSAFLGCLIVLRAISLHEVDRLLYRKRRLMLGLPLNLLIEPAGIAILALTATLGCLH